MSDHEVMYAYGYITKKEISFWPKIDAAENVIASMVFSSHPGLPVVKFLSLQYFYSINNCYGYQKCDQP